MKKMIFSIAMLGLMTAACNTKNADDQKVADSLAAAAAADSMLNSALQDDTIGLDSLDSNAAVLDTGAIEHLP